MKKATLHKKVTREGGCVLLFLDNHESKRQLLLKPQRGFTVVELLIVIVVIGILAAMTIIAFNGVQQRARETSLKADLSNSAKKMAADNVLNGSYPLSAAAVDGGKGLPSSAGTTYQFQSTGSSYCITGSNGDSSFKVSDAASSPSQGGCAGDDAGGVAAIVNLVANPSLETNTTGWDRTYVAGTLVSRVTGGVGIVSGDAAIEASITTANAAGVRYVFGSLQADARYTASVYATLVSGDPANLIMRIADGSGTRATKSATSSLIVGQPTRISVSWQSSPTNPNGGDFSIMRSGVSTSMGVIRLDGLMITAGDTLYPYADGSSANWIWNGTPNSSTSRGQAQ